MSMSIAARYAIRSLLRHRRRTLLSVIGIGVGCAVCLFLVSFVRGEGEMMMRAAAESGAGHLRIAPRSWLEARDNALRLQRWESLLRTVRNADGVEVAAPHARIDALLAMGTRTAGVVMTGVDPRVEPAINRLVHAVSAGTYLAAGGTGTVVVGQGVARRLDVGLGDNLMVTVSGKDDEMHSAMLVVQGIVRTGSRDLDGSLCHVLLADVEAVSGYDGAAEISVLLKAPQQLEDMAAKVRLQLAPDEALVTWAEIVPELAAGVEVDETWTDLTVGVVVVVVFLGIASAQLAAVLERRREFAVLSALGMKGGRLMRVMVAEGALLGVAGSVAALFIATPFVYAISAYGIDFGRLFSAVDMFAPFSPLEVDREWRRGVDAVRAEYRWSPTTSFEAIAVGGASWADSALVLRARGYTGNLDAELLGGKRAEDEFLATVVSSTLGDAELHGELAVFRIPEPHPDGGAWGSDRIVPKAVFGSSYTFDVGNGLTMVGEYHYSGFGARDTADATALFANPDYQARLRRGDTQILGRHAVGLQASYPFHESLSGALTALANPTDGSGMISPSVRWDLSRITSLIVIGYVPWGDSAENGVLQSEYGASPQSLFVQLGMYF